MSNVRIDNSKTTLESLGVLKTKNQYWNLTPEELVEHSLKKELGILTTTGALAINTGKFTGRSPLDRFIVKDEITLKSVDWGDINIEFDPGKFDALELKLKKYFEGKDVYIHDGKICADDNYALNARLIAELPWSAQFANNMFIRLTDEQKANFTPEWHVYNAPGFLANPKVDGTRQENFAIINFSKKTIIVGGTGYTGEIKKGMFSVANFVLPKFNDVLTMHCSANVGTEGDTNIFFGLSGTGKTTLSADPSRFLIGDDEHGWSNEGVFNFEGGCYAKTIDLSQENEPDIFNAIKHGAILENIGYLPNSRTPDFANIEITQNTRVSYPLEHINKLAEGSKGGHPKNIFFLTADAFGVLPPISRLDEGQAMYYFISGYTAKVAGAEEGVTEPQATFSACFGAPFMPLHPTEYAKMLGDKIKKHKTKVWLVNTGWTGGEYGVGSRIKLKYTRAMITAAMKGELDEIPMMQHPVFGLFVPVDCPNIPNDILNPKNTWDDKKAYDEKADLLARKFNENFKKFESKASKKTLDAAPTTFQVVAK